MKYMPSVGTAEEVSIRRQEDLNKKEELDLIDAELVKVEQRSVQAAIQDLQRRPDVEYAQPNHIYQRAGYSDEPFFEDLWGLNNTGQAVNGHPAGTSNVDIDALEASARTRGNPNLVVAVMDDGVDFSHPDLANRQWTNPGESGGGKETNGVDDDGNGYVDDFNGWNFYYENNRVHNYGIENDHGTHVAGTIAASLNNRGVVGVAPNVKIMALKVLGPQSTDSATQIEAVGYAKAKGAKILNASLGGYGDPDDPALEDAIKASGILLVYSAMNGGSDGVGDNNDIVPVYPASLNAPNILSVAAVDNRGRLGSFSNYGPTSVDISAPGVDILSTIPAINEETISGMALSTVDSSGKALVAGFGAEEISNSAAARASFFTKAFSAVGRGSQPVLLVDDDLSDRGAPDVGSTISAAIQSATGSAPTEIDVPYGSNGPTLAQMQGKTVVWATGNAFYSELNSAGTQVTKRTLTNPDLDNTYAFLNSGGKLILTGKDALFLTGNTIWATDKLGIEVYEDQGATAFSGKPGTTFAGESYNIDATPDYHDLITPASFKATTQGSYDDYASILRPAALSYFDGTSMAAPHVTAVAALAGSVKPSLLSNPVALKKVVMDTGKPAPATAGKTVTGDIVDADAAIDTAKPRVSASTPTGTGVRRNANLTATFSEKMNQGTITRSTFKLFRVNADGSTTQITNATVALNASGLTATLNPFGTASTLLAANTKHQAVVTTGAKDLAGNPLDQSPTAAGNQQKVWTFTTGST